MTLSDAIAMLDAAIARATAEGTVVAAVVLDGAGAVVALRRMDGALPSAVQLAEKKAYGAVNFRLPTQVAAESFPPHLQLTLLAAEPRVTFLHGGVPVSRDGRVVGAIGVAGGSGEQDVACCEAAVSALKV